MSIEDEEDFYDSVPNQEEDDKDEDNIYGCIINAMKSMTSEPSKDTKKVLILMNHYFIFQLLD